MSAIYVLAGAGRHRCEAAYLAWLGAERGRFALFLPVFMAAGIIYYFSLASEPAVWPAMALVAGATAAAAAVRRSFPTRAVCLSVAALAVGFASANLASQRALPWDGIPHAAAIAFGRVAQLDLLPEGRRVTLAAVSLQTGERLHRMVRIRLRDSDLADLAVGDTAQIRALLRPPAPPDYPGGWDTQRDAFFSGLGAYGFAIGPVKRVSAAPGSAWQRLRETVAQRFVAGLPGSRGAIAAALMTGLGTAIPPADRAAFAASGLAHLLAVAGLHIGIVMALVFGLVRACLAVVEYTALYWPTRQAAAIAALAGGAFYLALTGGHVPILRSFAMASLVTLAVLTGRRAVSARALALAATALMLAAPNEVMGVSFQMSFAAVLALVAGWEALRPFLARFALGRWWRAPVLYAGGLAVTSALAGTASLPFAIYHFGSATLWYVPANLLAVPLTAFWIMPCGIVALLLMPFGAEHWALEPMGWGVGLVLRLARAVAAWPGAASPVPQIPPAAVMLASVGLAWLCLWRTQVRLAGLPMLLAAAALPLFVARPEALVTPGAHVAAARIAGIVFSETRGAASPFERQAPGRVWGVTATQPFPATGDAAGGALRCDALVCRWRSGSATFLLPRAAEAPCHRADVAIATIVLHGCDAALVVDRRTVAEDGATLVTGGRVVADADQRGDRPWVIREGPLLPPARTE